MFYCFWVIGTNLASKQNRCADVGVCDSCGLKLGGAKYNCSPDSGRTDSQLWRSVPILMELLLGPIFNIQL